MPTVFTTLYIFNIQGQTLSNNGEYTLSRLEKANFKAILLFTYIDQIKLKQFSLVCMKCAFQSFRYREHFNTTANSAIQFLLAL